jgi:GMP synthase (glutamine-hydrolysing)
MEHGDELPNVSDCTGVIITGSHAMVTESLPWSIRLEKWIPSLLNAKIPLLGVCYGHQLLVKSMGGEVGFHPDGKEIGTVEIKLKPEYINDALFQSLPQRFNVHVSHSQTVLRMPPGAVSLAANAHDPNQAIRLGDSAWGVQFHPEYDASIMQSYIREQARELNSKGQNVSELLHNVKETPYSAQILRNFTQIVEGGRAHSL